MKKVIQEFEERVVVHPAHTEVWYEANDGSRHATAKDAKARDQSIERNRIFSALPNVSTSLLGDGFRDVVEFYFVKDEKELDAVAYGKKVDPFDVRLLPCWVGTKTAEISFYDSFYEWVDIEDYVDGAREFVETVDKYTKENK